MKTQHHDVTCVTGLTKTEAEQLLDRLEILGYQRCEVFSPDGLTFTVRYSSRD